MTLKYESEILFDLMKRDGDDTPSDVLPYESELKEKYLQQVEGAYPKLMDYRPEWLNYNLNAHLPADFPVETLSNVTEATVDNVVPYAYGSAILKGQTLVNLMSTGETFTVQRTNPGKWSQVYLEYNNQMLAEGTYILTWDELTTTNETIDIGGLLGVYASRVDGGFQNSWSNNKDLKYLKFQVDYSINNIGSFSIRLHVTKGNSYDGVVSSTIKGLKLLKYQEGMENWDIPYFEGMQSVEMPVLTTTGKNLLGDNKVITGYYNGADIFYNNPSFITYENPINVIPNTQYIFSNNIQTRYGRINFYDENMKIIDSITDSNLSPFVTPNNCYFIRVTTYVNSGISPSDIIWSQLENSPTATPYEPYKSNILTVNEDVTLRGIGDVQDTLDCLTGEIVERIGEIVLDGSDDEIWSVTDGLGGLTYFRIVLSDMIKSDTAQEKLMFDKINVCSYSYLYNSESIPDEIIGATTLSKSLQSQVIYIYYKNIGDVNTFKTYLQQNPITVQYQLATESIKTVDLTVTDQDGNTESIIRPIEGTMHVSTSSQTLPPLLDMSVPVEATTQNLMSFANMLEEEK